jgi:hypothetical protein
LSVSSDGHSCELRQGSYPSYTCGSRSSQRGRQRSALANVRGRVSGTDIRNQFNPSLLQKQPSEQDHHSHRKRLSVPHRGSIRAKPSDDVIRSPLISPLLATLANGSSEVYLRDLSSLTKGLPKMQVEDRHQSSRVDVSLCRYRQNVWPGSIEPATRRSGSHNLVVN